MPTSRYNSLIILKIESSWRITQLNYLQTIELNNGSRLWLNCGAVSTSNWKCLLLFIVSETPFWTSCSSMREKFWNDGYWRSIESGCHGFLYGESLTLSLTWLSKGLSFSNKFILCWCVSGNDRWWRWRLINGSRSVRGLNIFKTEKIDSF